MNTDHQGQRTIMGIQMRDTLVVAGEKLLIKNVEFGGGRTTYSPLYPLLEQKGLMEHFRIQNTPYHPNNLCGYLCEWSLSGSTLHLIGFHSRSSSLRTLGELMQEGHAGIAGLSNVPERYLASWFSGTLDVVESLADIQGQRYRFVNGTVVEIVSYR